MSEEKKHKFVLTPEGQEAKIRPTKPIDYWLYIIIGISISLINLLLNNITRNPPEMKLLAYFYILAMLVIPALIFGNFKRPRGYGFIIGYIVGSLAIIIKGLIYRIDSEIFIGGYSLFVSFMLFFIIILVFKIWRSFDKLKY